MMRRRALLGGAEPKPSGALYWYGDECTAVTGGFADGYLGITSSYWYSVNRKGILTKLSDKMFFGCGNIYALSNVGSIMTRPINQISLTGWSKINIHITDYYSTNTRDSKNMYIAINDATTISSWNNATKYLRLKPPSDGTFSLDIASFTGDYYILLCLTNETEGHTDLCVDKVWLE